MKAFYKKIIEANEQRIPYVLANSYEDTNSVFHGGYKDGNGLAEHYSTVSQMMHLSAAYFCKENMYYKNKEIFVTINEYITFYFNTVRPNGTGDCLISDFFTPSSFDAINVARAYRIFEKYTETENEKKTKHKIYQMLEKMGEGFLNGGHRTPNHRWMMAAASSMIFNITGKVELKELALKYLDEGIDIDEYGEFTERSPGMYNEVNDNALFILARELDLPYLYDSIKLNMDLLFKYMEPDGTIFTQNSARKDKGENEPSMGFYPTRYFYIYLQGAYVLKNEKYAYFAHQVMFQTIKYQRAIPEVLWLYMINEQLKTFEPKTIEIDKNYEMYNPTSSIYRKVEDDFSVSVIGNNANFLFVQKGDLKVYMRLCASFFMKAQFKPEKIEKNGDTLTLKFSVNDMYWKPFEENQGTSVWKEMDHSKRKTCNKRYLNYLVIIKIINKTVDINIRVDGTDRVPFKAEFVVTSGSIIDNEHFTVKAEAGQDIILHEGYVNIKHRKDTIKIGPAFKQHIYTTNMRGSISKSSRGYTIYFTEYTEVDKNIKIICE